MYQLIIIVHVLLGLSVVGLILMQQGKGADAGAAFAGGSGSVFGAQGAASFLSRATAILAALFFTTSLGLAVLSGYENKPDDLMEQPVIETLVEDVPLMGVNKPSAESIPVIAPVNEVPVVPSSIEDTAVSVEPVVNTVVESVTETTSEPQQVVEPNVPVVNNVETTDAVESIVPTPSVEETTEIVTQP
ncbi:MAG: preprotein translocase subunit SecG [Methylococcales bacterium]|nr:preprotein translocase subunit SecG [Methylococcales bacterium]